MDNPLSNIVMGDHPKLALLQLLRTQLSAQSLNTLFESLHSNDINNKKVVIRGIPEADACNKSIATKKGWAVE
jgi:hypothetical protein